MQKKKQKELNLNGSDINKLVSGVIVGALLGLGTLFHRHIISVEEQVRDAKVILRIEIRDTKQDLKYLETRVRKIENICR